MPTVHDFAYTGAGQSVVVPAGVTEATLEVWGASGGTGAGQNKPGGAGAYLSIDITALTPGETLYVYVGQLGPDAASHANAYNGGGKGHDDYRDGGSGGGATDIRRGGTALADRIAIGGGGGGGSGMRYAGDGDGGAGGYPNGATGLGGTPGGGGTQSAGGAAGYAGTAGSLGQGAIGGVTSTFQNNSGGGGGGGLYGGGMAGASYSGAGGGGGSSYYDTGDVTVTLNSAEAAGTWTGNGKARITFADVATLGTVDLGAADVTAALYATASRQRRPRIEHIWLHDLTGERVGVLR